MIHYAIVLVLLLLIYLKFASSFFVPVFTHLFSHYDHLHTVYRMEREAPRDKKRL